ncbi:MAG: exopolyphosphatase [Planctomycetota bacterium]|nr:MAG: exopolyphosphatase [Planctomycetota bacterium]
MVAAVDLGSNSFHMIIARQEGAELRILDRVRERVQLGAGLDKKKRLAAPARERALECLRRMRQRLQEIPPDRIRAVGTNTLRRAKNAREFLGAAHGALGHTVEIISGQEEARLIYLGVAHTTADDLGRRFVVDIGGGSTECILGEGFDVLRADSLHMGCVSYTQRFFPKGEPKKAALRKAVIAARVELQTLSRPYRNLGWEVAYGASGTVHAVADILRACGWAEGGITRPGLRKLRKALLAAESIAQLSLPGLKAERAAVLPGGWAILQAVFESLDLECLRPASGALREGVLYDLLGRIRHEGVRERTIRRFVERYHVDLEQAARVERTALQLLERLRGPWDLGSAYARKLLVWAARLHEVGMVVSYNGHHKHGAYLLANSTMPGFSTDDQQQLAALVRMHRRKIPRDEVVLVDIPPLGVRRLLRLGVILRLAVLLNRSRSPEPQPAFFIEAEIGRLHLIFPTGWLEAHPLTRADLEAEATILASRGFRLTVQ